MRLLSYLRTILIGRWLHLAMTSSLGEVLVWMNIWALCHKLWNITFWNIQFSWAKPLHYYSIWSKKRINIEMNILPAWQWSLWVKMLKITPQCKFLLILKMGCLYSSVPPGCNVLNYAKIYFNDMLYWHIRRCKQNYEIAYGFEEKWYEEKC